MLQSVLKLSLACVFAFPLFAHAHHYTDAQSSALRANLSTNLVPACARYIRDDGKLSPNYRVKFANTTGDIANKIVQEKVHKYGNYMFIMWKKGAPTPFFLGDYSSDTLLLDKVVKTKDIFGKEWFISRGYAKCQGRSQIEPLGGEYQ